MPRFERMPRPTVVVVVWRLEETCRVRCTGRRTKASEPTLTASGLVAKRRAERTRVNLCLGVLCFWRFVL